MDEMISSTRFERLELGLRDNSCFAPEYWQSFTALANSLERIYFHADVFSNRSFLTLKKRNPFKIEGVLAHRFGDRKELFYEIPVSHFALPIYQRRYLSDVWYRHPGRIFFLSNNKLHWDLLMKHYELISPSVPQERRRREMDATIDCANIWGKEAIDMNPGVGLIWWFLWDGDTAGAYRRETMLSYQ